MLRALSLTGIQTHHEQDLQLGRHTRAVGDGLLRHEACQRLRVLLHAGACQDHTAAACKRIEQLLRTPTAASSALPRYAVPHIWKSVWGRSTGHCYDTIMRSESSCSNLDRRIKADGSLLKKGVCRGQFELAAPRTDSGSAYHKSASFCARVACLSAGLNNIKAL